MRNAIAAKTESSNAPINCSECTAFNLERISSSAVCFASHLVEMPIYRKWKPESI